MSKPPDPWKSVPPTLRWQTDAAPAAGGRPPGLDTAQSRAALASSTRQLRRWLGVLSGVLLGAGLLGGLGLLLGGVGAAQLASDTPPGLSWLLALAGLLVVALYGLYAAVIRWARELIVRLGSWALETQGRAPIAEAARTERLRRTLSGWLTFGQWGTAAGLVLGVLAVPLSTSWLPTLPSSLDRSAPTPGLLAFGTLAVLLSGAPGVVMAWLILAAVRRFMNASVTRALGRPGLPITPAASSVSNWLLVCAVLLALNGVVLLLGTVLLGVFGSLFRAALSSRVALGVPQDWQGVFPNGLSSVLDWWLGGTVVLLLLSGLLLALLFALLLWSRQYAAALAEELDAARLA